MWKPLSKGGRAHGNPGTHAAHRAGLPPRYTEVVAKRPRTDDLFALFPDLPWTRPNPVDDRARILRQVDGARARVDANIHRQKAASERFRAMLSARRRR
jgi:hypothetical protein